MGYSVGTLNKMPAIIFLKIPGMLIGLLGGYQEMQLSGKKSFLNMASRWKMFQGRWVSQEKTDILKGVFCNKRSAWVENGACKDD